MMVRIAPSRQALRKKPQKKARMMSFGPGLKTAGFPQHRTSLRVRQPTELRSRGQYLFSQKEKFLDKTGTVFAQK